MDSLREKTSDRLHLKKSICADRYSDDDFKDTKNKSLGIKRGAVSAPDPIERGGNSSDSMEQDSNSDDSWGEMSNGSLPIEVDDSQPTGPLYPSKRTAPPTINTLKKRLLDSEKLNSRLKRAVDRLRRQNVKFKNKLIEKESQA